MNKIRIAVASGILAALLGGAAVHGASAAPSSHPEAGPVQCCFSAILGSHG
jgi:hypothetical protein